MIDLNPRTHLALGIMLRELEKIVIPDLSSENAKLVAQMIGRGLRALLTREDTLPALMDEWSRSERELLDEAGFVRGAEPDDVVERREKFGTALETIVAERAGGSKGRALDEFCRRAVAAERDHFARRAELVDAVPVPRRAEDSRALMAMTPERLSAYFSRKMPHYRKLKVTNVVPVLSGYSKETLLVDMEADEVPMPVVIRRNIPFSPVVNSTVVDEYPLIVALHRHGLAVPEPVLLEADRSEFGEAFTVTKRAPGRAAASSMGALGGSPDMRTAALEFARFMARLHCVDPRALDLPKSIYDPAMTMRDCLLREIDISEGYYRDHRLQPSSTIAAAIAWLRVNIPESDDPPRLVHGDAWLTNLLMDGDKMTVMVDWELTHLGDPNFDLAYCKKWMQEVMPWEEFLAHYHAHGGPSYRPEREKFHLLLVNLKIARYLVRTLDMIRKTDHPEISHLHTAFHNYGYFVGKLADDLLAL